MKSLVVTLLLLLFLSGCAGEVTEAPQTVDTSVVPTTVGTSGAPHSASTSETTPTEPPFPFKEEVTTRLEYKPGTSMTIVRTGHTDAPAPCVVILHGYKVAVDFYLPLARAITEKNAVVFIPDWNATLPSVEDPRTTTVTDGLDDVADAIRFVRQYAGRYEGDPGRVILVGHSFGATIGLTTMLAGDGFGTGAFSRESSALPDAYVSLDGVVPFKELLWDDTLRRLYDQDPVTWDKINPDTYLEAAGDRKGVPFLFFVATLDLEPTEALAKRMSKLGYETSVERIAVNHMQAAEPQAVTVDAIADLAHSDK